MTFRDLYTKPGADKAKFYFFVYAGVMMGLAIELNRMALLDGFVLFFFFFSFCYLIYFAFALGYSWVLRCAITRRQIGRAGHLMRGDNVRSLAGEGEVRDVVRFYPRSLPRWLREIRLSVFVVVAMWITAANLYRLFFVA